MNTGKRIIVSASFMVLSTGWAAAAPASVLDFLNLRIGPGFEFGVIEVIPPGGIINVANCSLGWCQVNIDGIVGFVDPDYLDFAGPSVAYGAPSYWAYPFYGARYGYGVYPDRYYYGFPYYPSYSYRYGYYSVPSLGPYANAYAEVRDVAITADRSRQANRVGHTAVTTNAPTNASRAKHPKG